MHRLLSLLIFVTLFGCKNKDIPNYLTENNLKGDILEFSDMQYFEVNSPINKYDSKTTIKLNDEGNIIEEYHMGLKTVYKYEKGWKIITISNEEIKIILNTFKTKRLYENGIFKEFTYYDDGKLISSTEKKFDQNNRVIQEREYNTTMHGNINYKRKFRYLGRFITEIISYDENFCKTRPTTKSIETKDKFGNIISIKTTLLNRENPKTERIPEQIYKYDYDAKGNWTTQYWYTENDSVPFMKNTRTYVYR